MSASGVIPVPLCQEKVKKSMWDTWMIYSDLTNSLIQLSNQPGSIPDKYILIIGRLFVWCMTEL